MLSIETSVWGAGGREIEKNKYFDNNIVCTKKPLGNFSDFCFGCYLVMGKCGKLRERERKRERMKKKKIETGRQDLFRTIHFISIESI